MAVQKLADALKETTLALADKFLIVSTIEDGYTGTYQGNHPYKVLRNELGDYSVYPVYLNPDGVLTNEKYPIIQTDGDIVFFTLNTTVDPYNFAFFDKVEEPNTNKEQQILLAFEAFIHDEFRLGSYNVFVDDTPAITDEPSNFEFTTEFERDVIHPKAGEINTPEEPADPSVPIPDEGGGEEPPVEVPEGE